MKSFLIVVMLLISFNVHAANGEFYMKNGVGGYVTLTQEPCELGVKVANQYPKKIYSTNDQGNPPDYGCYDIPSLAEAPPSTDKMRIIPIVNIFIEKEGVTRSMPLEWFSPTKEGELLI